MYKEDLTLNGWYAIKPNQIKRPAQEKNMHWDLREEITNN